MSCIIIAGYLTTLLGGCVKIDLYWLFPGTDLAVKHSPQNVSRVEVASLERQIQKINVCFTCSKTSLDINLGSLSCLNRQ